jgi:hypothetical protein
MTARGLCESDLSDRQAFIVKSLTSLSSHLMQQKAGYEHGQSTGCGACKRLNDDCFGRRKRHRVATCGYRGGG